MPTYSFQMSAGLAGSSVSVTAAGSTDVVASGTLDANALFTASLPVGDYVATAAGGHYSYRSAGTVAQSDPDQLADLNSTFAPKARASRTIILGDSIDAAMQGWWPYYLIGSDKIQQIRNAGISGNTTDQMLARIQTDVLAYSPDVVVLGGATNDHRTTPEATTRANVKAMVDAVQATGAAVVLRTVPPADVVSSGAVAPYDTVQSRRDAVNRYNAWLKGFAAKRGLDVLDLYQAVADPATGGYKAGITSDGIHPTETGSKAIADYLLALPIPAVWKGGFAFARAVSESGNMLANGVFVGDSNADGLANSWPIIGTPTCSLTAASTGITGNWQRVTAADGTNAGFLQDILTGYSPGDIIEAVCRVRSSGGGSAVTIRLAPWASAQLAIDLVSGTTKALDGVASARMTVPSDLTKIRVSVSTANAAGWVEVAEFAVRNLTALGLA